MQTENSYLQQHMHLMEHNDNLNIVLRNMKFETTTLREDKYIAPLCTTTDMVSEGVLCNSFETPMEYDDLYKW